MAFEFTDAVLAAVRTSVAGLDLLGTVLARPLGEQGAGEVPARSSTSPDEAKPMRFAQSEIPPWTDVAAGIPDLSQRLAESKGRRQAVAKGFLDLVAEPTPMEDPPRNDPEGNLVPMLQGARTPLRRFAFGGGDLGALGVSPADLQGFPASEPAKPRRGISQRRRMDGSVETHYIASNALEAILKLVDESVARQLGAMGPR